MLFLFAISIVAFIVALALFLAPLFQFVEPKPMLEQIEEAREANRLNESPVVFTIAV